MRVKIPKPIARFRVYVNASLYYLVTVFRTKKDMHRFCKAGACRRGAYPGTRFQACVHSFTKVSYRGKRPRKRPILGHIHFHEKMLTMNVITHESVHAALGYFRRVETWRLRKYGMFPNKSTGLLDVMAHEEELCYAAGHIGKEIVSRCEQFKLL